MFDGEGQQQEVVPPLDDGGILCALCVQYVCIYTHTQMQLLKFPLPYSVRGEM